jgi:hypothetical protein
MTFPVNVTKNVSPVYSGDSWVFSCLFTREDGTPIDLITEGWTEWKSQWRPYAKSSEYINLDVNTTDAANGRISISMSREDTSSMTTDGVFDLEAVQAGATRTWVRGDVKFSKDVTR